MATPTLAVIIVNWNAGDQLRACLQALVDARQQRFHLAQVVVVDNASQDDSLANLPADRLPLRVIRNPDNRGFGVACNQGAAEAPTDYLLFLNPDTRIEADALDHAVAHLESPAGAAAGVCGARLLGDQGQTHRHCARQVTAARMWANLLGVDRLTPWTSGYLLRRWDHGHSQPVNHVMGAFYLIRRDLFAALGGFDPRFFVYLEDLDLSERVRRAGWRIDYCAAVRVYHKGGGTSEQIKARRLYYSLDSRLRYARKHFTPISAAGIWIGTLFIEPPLRLGQALARGSFAQVHEVLAAYRWLVQDLPARWRLPEPNPR
jgi:GT2 family glycosyltransferase